MAEQDPAQQSVATPEELVTETTPPQTSVEQTVDHPSAEKPVNDVLLSWEAPEFIFYEKDRQWFVYGAVAVAVLVVIAAFLQQWLMIVVILVLAGVLYQHSRREPRILKYAITELGIQVGDRFHPFNELKSFWILYNPPLQVLGLETTKRVVSQFQIQLGDQDPIKVKQLLHSHLPEQEKRQEDWLDAFGRLIRF